MTARELIADLHRILYQRGGRDLEVAVYVDLDRPHEILHVYPMPAWQNTPDHVVLSTAQHSRSIGHADCGLCVPSRRERARN